MNDFDWIGTARRGGWVSAQQAMELRTRIAEWESEASGYAKCCGAAYARIAELEADRDHQAEEIRQYADWMVDRDNRIAAVIALCDRLGGPDMSGGPNYVGQAIAREFRAAATREIQ